MTIKILPAMLANQIAAGEVVERPASVVKEIVENSLDAGARKIDIDIEKGGHKRICVRDDGKGIDKDELELALSRHATSKIADLDDLEHICSLGFRGEALASISAVSRLTLTSRTAEQSAAWQAYAEGRDMQVIVKPAAHPQGTSVDVQDLFFNTPARRKFLRAEKTEFSHIDEWLKRIALSRFDVSFSLRHNGKRVRHYPAITGDSDKTRRVGLVTHKLFAEQALQINSQYDGLSVSGYVHTNRDDQLDVQYFYVNGRVMRDKLINHAIRQASAEFFGEQHQLAYVLYLSLPPEQVDINVHPAKHEVRFHQSRQVHDFIYRALIDTFAQESVNSAQPAEPSAAGRVLSQVEPEHEYRVPLERQRHVSETPTHRGADHRVADHRGADHRGADHRGAVGPTASPSPKALNQYQHLLSTSPSRVQWIVMEDGSLLVYHSALFKLHVTDVLRWHMQAAIDENSLTSQPLLMPLSVTVPKGTQLEQLTQWQSVGLHLLAHQQKVILRQVPACLRHFDWASIIPVLLTQPEPNLEGMLAAIRQSNQTFTPEQVASVWQWAQSHYGEALVTQCQQCATPLSLES